MTANGKDKFGTFVLDTCIKPCGHCNATTVPRIAYTKPLTLPPNIDPKDTIIKDPTHMWLGITCGCYSKFHRQVAHIETTMKLREKV